MRVPALILVAASLASPAAAQTAFDTLHLENRLAAQQYLARQNALAADREALVLESRARTAAALQSLEAARLMSPAAEPASAPLDPQLAAAIEAVAKAQGKALEESNARLRVIAEGVGD